jgi:DNA-binding response OmpR family regulator
VRHHILCVEDDIELRNVFAELLARAGYQVEVAEDGLVGWEALRLGSYNLMITDNQMPRLSGLQLVERLRSTGNNLPVVLMSGSSSFENLQSHQWPQRTTALKKPFTPAELLATIEDVLRTASADPQRSDLFFPPGPSVTLHVQAAPRMGNR